MAALMQMQMFICSSVAVNIVQNCSFIHKRQTPINCRCFSRPKVASLHLGNFKLKISMEKRRFLEVYERKDMILVRDGGLNRGRRAVLARFLGFNGGGGGKDDGSTARVVGNLVLAIGLTYLTISGQLGWVLDTIVSIWLFVVLVPIVGLGAFIWWAGRDIVQSACPNCGNNFQIFKSMLNDEVQLCPYCTQPFSVIDDKFVKEPVKFTNDFTSKASPRPKKGMDSSTAIVDVEAEVKDID